jgi:hypothetical protein
MEGKYVERYEELKNESILCTDHISIWMKGTLASLKKNGGRIYFTLSNYYHFDN